MERTRFVAAQHQRHPALPRVAKEGIFYHQRPHHHHNTKSEKQYPDYPIDVLDIGGVEQRLDAFGDVGLHQIGGKNGKQCSSKKGDTLLRVIAIA